MKLLRAMLKHYLLSIVKKHNIKMSDVKKIKDVEGGGNPPSTTKLLSIISKLSIPSDTKKSLIDTLKNQNKKLWKKLNTCPIKNGINT